MTRCLYSILVIFCCLIFSLGLNGQTSFRGEIFDAETGEPLIGANVVIVGTTTGTVTDFDGKFELKTSQPLPFNISVIYTGYESSDHIVNENNQYLRIKLAETAVMIDAIEVTGSRISDKQKESPLTVESLDVLAIKATPSANFYDGLGALKDVDLTAASLGFKVINTRGFNSTSPVRSLQVIDGVDNQAPGLNFSLGNFLGSSELDVVKVDIIAGASSAYYGPNAFNGVINMETKNPFIHQGLSGMVRVGERSLFEGALRYADAFSNQNGNEVFAFKFNLAALRANDWEAVNYAPITDSEVGTDNPGGWDAVNIYGDEYFALADVTGGSAHLISDPGLGNFYRTGYKEIDLVDYGTRNYKANMALHLRTAPVSGIESPELILSSNFGSGTTVYQGDNRFSLRNILFFQNRIEFRKREKFFIRAYATHEDAGKSYDPYFTALRLQEYSKSDEDWALDYRRFWKGPANFPRRMRDLGYPSPVFDPVTGTITFDEPAALQWLETYQDSLVRWHALSAEYANTKNIRPEEEIRDFLVPGTARFDSIFSDITTRYNNEDGGTRFFDKSALYHVHGEYTFTPTFIDEIRVGANYRLFAPSSRGTIFNDSTEVIRNSEVGMYVGLQEKFIQNKLIASATLRVDKNQNMRWIQTPAASLIYKPVDNTYLRVSFSSALRNPTLSDQYLDLNVGPAILAGHIGQVDSLITIESFVDGLNTLNWDTLQYFSIDAIRPEKVNTIEFGFRTTLFKNLFVDMTYYRNEYKHFLGYQLGIRTDLDLTLPPPVFPENTTVYRYSANSKTKVSTQGFSIGLNYFLSQSLTLTGNYSFNELRKADEDDPIIPAFNTPKNKFNLGINAKEINISDINFLRNFGFGVNYKWVEGFVFEGSPQFTGFVPSYGLLDAQVNMTLQNLNTTIKVGASNLLNNEHFETYGGPFIGRMGYISLLYDFKKE